MLISGFIFILGLVFGSFLNAWEYRIESKMSLNGRSLCPKCKEQIAWHDNIPLFSWLLLRGKCRHCQKAISIQYPAVELITAIVFLLIWLFSSPGVVLSQWLDGIYNPSVAGQVSSQFPIFEFIKLLLLTSCFIFLILVALYDAKTKYVLTKHVYVAGTLGLVYNLLNVDLGAGWAWVLPYLGAITIPAGLFWLLSKTSQERLMGAGDADIALTIGLLLGWPKVLPAYYIAFITGAIYGIGILASKKGGLKSQVPLGPFLIAGAFFALIFGQQILDIYLHFIGVM
jgi:leader peptidase (prepilin peptidase)/N-methyltransferase